MVEQLDSTEEHHNRKRSPAQAPGGQACVDVQFSGCPKVPASQD
jgi:hypothetical protein